MPIEALFFDVGNTLLFPNRERMLKSLHGKGIVPPEDLLQSIERRTKNEFDELMENHRSVDHGFWWMFYSHLLHELNIFDEASCAELVANTQVSANWCDIRPGTREALLRLRDQYRLGVISNADGKIANVLEHCGIADCFETITDSGIVGKEKPHRMIFESALQSLDVEPQNSMYTGDVYSVDYLGATSAGMECVLFDVAGAYRDREIPRVQSLDELEILLQRRHSQAASS